MLLGDRIRWDRVEVVTAAEPAPAVVVSVIREDRTALLGRGDPAGTARLVRERVAERAEAGLGTGVGWMSLPRAADVGPDLLHALGLAPFSTWDWLVTDREPAPVEGEARVLRLDRHEQADLIRDCLAEANPGTTADPTAAQEAAWFGVPDGDRLAGVFGASLRGGSGDGWSWHLHGLGVRPAARGRGLGAALTAAATRAGLQEGAEWVSLGMYADNDVARRVYHRIGYVTDAEFASWAPVGVRRPPS